MEWNGEVGAVWRAVCSRACLCKLEGGGESRFPPSLPLTCFLALNKPFPLLYNEATGKTPAGSLRGLPWSKGRET